jgi:hypothetical protein
MKTLQKSALVVSLIDRLRAHGSWCGETHVQKAAYVAGASSLVPLGFDFVLYRHGPFSFEMRDFLGDMRAEGFIDLEPQYPYGPRLRPAKRAALLIESNEEFLHKYSERLDEIAKFIGSQGVASLERLATALYFLTSHPYASDGDIASMVHAEKPHVSLEAALGSAREVREWMRSVKTTRS